MSLTLIIAIISMFLALGFYSAGVFGERRSKSLKTSHLIFFWIGFFFDSFGTTMMSRLSDSFSFSLHTLTGALAIALMLIHALWASYVIIGKDEKKKENFHRISIFVWILWLIPFLSGMIIAMI
jgi:uncharacterized repeat protein (TIGR03987 family)